MTLQIPAADETVTVTIGLLGAAATALGTAHLHVDFDPRTADTAEVARSVGEAVSAAYMDALTDAMREFQPALVEHFRDQRIRNSDGSVE